MSETPEYRERLEEIKGKIRLWAKKAAEKWPSPSLEQKRRGCIQIVWDDQSEAARSTEERLDHVIHSYAFEEADDAAVRVAWEEYVRVRKRRWKDGIPQPFTGEPDF
jgi:hypothetical protein